MELKIVERTRDVQTHNRENPVLQKWMLLKGFELVRYYLGADYILNNKVREEIQYGIYFSFDNGDHHWRDISAPYIHL